MMYTTFVRWAAAAIGKTENKQPAASVRRAISFIDVNSSGKQTDSGIAILASSADKLNQPSID